MHYVVVCLEPRAIRARFVWFGDCVLFMRRYADRYPNHGALKWYNLTHPHCPEWVKMECDKWK